MAKIDSTTYREIKDFNKKEWKQADKEYYGKDVRWKEKTLFLKATEGKKIIGSLKMHIEGRGVEVSSIIIAKDFRGKGVGRKLMEGAENLAKKLRCHKMWLETGEGWDAEYLYKSLGYKTTTKLPKHYLKRDFILYTKFI